MPIRCAGVVAAASTQGKRTQHGKPQGVVRDDQPDAREGQAGPLRMHGPQLFQQESMLLLDRGQPAINASSPSIEIGDALRESIALCAAAIWRSTNAVLLEPLEKLGKLLTHGSKQGITHSSLPKAKPAPMHTPAAAAVIASCRRVGSAYC